MSTSEVTVEQFASLRVRVCSEFQVPRTDR